MQADATITLVKEPALLRGREAARQRNQACLLTLAGAAQDQGVNAMPRAFRVGDHVSWSSEAGRVSGVIRRKISVPMKFKGYTVHASGKEPQYLIESDKTDHLAMHKGSALRKLRSPARALAPSKGRHSRRGREP